MATILDENDVQQLIDDFGVNCLYFQAHASPKLYQGVPTLDSDAVHGYKYEAPVSCVLIRQSATSVILRTPEGKIFGADARFTIPPTSMDDNSVVTRPVIYDRVFGGDVIVVCNKPVRDYDILTRNVRDQLFAFDVKTIYKVVGLVAGTEAEYAYGTDYTLSMDGTDVPGTVQTDGSVIFAFPSPAPIASEIEIEWADGNGPADNTDYTVEFSSSPNYIVWPDNVRTRATEDNDLPKSVVCVKRAFFNKKVNAIDTIQERNAIIGGNDEGYDSSLEQH